MSLDKINYSLIIPCFNESKSLPNLIERCSILVSKKPIEVILVDNGSTDNTNEILKELLSNRNHIRSVTVRKNQGYGFGILSGLKKARGKIIGWTHADLQTDPLDVLDSIDLYEKNGNNIFTKGVRKGRPFADNFFTLGMSFFETVLLKKPLWDINAQPTMFPRVFFESWDDPPYDFSLDLYAYHLAKTKKIDVLRHKVYFGKRQFGVSSWNIDLKSKYRFIKRTVSFSFELKKRLDHGNNSPS